eukprot:g6424.t1
MGMSTTTMKLLLFILFSLPEVAQTQITKPPTTSTLALSNGYTIYHPILVSNKTRCWPLQRGLCENFRKGNPWTYGEFLAFAVWGPRRPKQLLAAEKLEKALTDPVGVAYWRKELALLNAKANTAASVAANGDVGTAAGNADKSAASTTSSSSSSSTSEDFSGSSSSPEPTTTTTLRAFPTLELLTQTWQAVGAEILAGPAPAFPVYSFYPGYVSLNPTTTTTSTPKGFNLTSSWSVVHRRLSQGCVPGLTGLLLQFPVPSRSAKYTIYWGDGRLFLPFPRNTNPLPSGVLDSRYTAPDLASLSLAEQANLQAARLDSSLRINNNQTTSTEKLQACRPDLPMVVREIDSNSPEIIAANLPYFDIGPMPFCTHEKALQQCCWLECGSDFLQQERSQMVSEDGFRSSAAVSDPTDFELGTRSDDNAAGTSSSTGRSRQKPMTLTREPLTVNDGPFCWFALETRELPLKSAESAANIQTDEGKGYSVWRVQRESAKVREDQLNEEMLNPSGMLSFGGITQDSLDSINIERDYPRHRLHAGIAKTYVPCSYCSESKGDYDADSGKINVKVIWEPHVMDPLLQLGDFRTFDHWVLSGNASRNYLYDLEQDLPVLIDDEIKNLTNRDTVLDSQVQYNNLNRPGLRLFVHVEGVDDDFPGYMIESRLQEDETYWPPGTTFFEPGSNKNWNCYAGRSVPVPDLIPKFWSTVDVMSTM